MSRVKIVYATKTGHSRKIAEEIGRELNISAQRIAENPDVGGTECLFIVGGIYGGNSLPEMLKYVGSLSKDKVRKAALVTSCLSKRQKQENVRSLLMEKGIEVVDEYKCCGSFLFFGLGHPNIKEIRKAADFAKEIADKL